MSVFPGRVLCSDSILPRIAVTVDSFWVFSFMLRSSHENDRTQSRRSFVLGRKIGLDAVVGEAPQFDDVTTLRIDFGCIRRNTRVETQMNEITVEATVANIGAVTEFVDSRLEKLYCSAKVQAQINMAIDELFGNIAYYAYHPDIGQATVRVEIEEEPLSVIITFMDGGVPYDPLKKADPDVTLSAEERDIGGLGIFLVKNSMDDIFYEYRGGQNILKIRKKI